MRDGLENEKSFRAFNVMDDFNHEDLNIAFDRSVLSFRIVKELVRLFEWREVPETLRFHHEPECIAQVLKDWCSDKIDLMFIHKKP